MEELVKELKEIYVEKFGDCLFHNSYGCFGKDTIFIRLFLAKDESEVANRIMDNDMFSILLELRDFGNEYKLEKVLSGVREKPMDKYCYCSSKRIPYRVTLGDGEKIKKAFKKYVDNLHSILIEEFNNGNIHENDIELLKRKLGL